MQILRWQGKGELDKSVGSEVFREETILIAVKAHFFLFLWMFYRSLCNNFDSVIFKEISI